jgi:hypothetical protein
MIENASLKTELQALFWFKRPTPSPLNACAIHYDFEETQLRSQNANSYVRLTYIVRQMTIKLDISVFVAVSQ